MVEKHSCKLCLRRFPNGRALGGHMRSHTTSVTRSPPTPPTQVQRRHSSTSSSSSSLQPGGAGGPLHGLRENINITPKSSRLDGPDISDDASESQSRITCRKRRRRSSPAEPEAVSSVSDPASATTDEDVAFCLVMLSMDTWEESSTGKTTTVAANKEEEEAEKEKVGGATSSEERRWSSSKFRCSTCRKAFRSYQALGGHMASHKRIKAGARGSTPPRVAEEGEPGDEQDRKNQVRKWEAAGADGGQGRAHECPFCGKVFGSGQALGGHKRVHYSFAPCADGGGGEVIEEEEKELLDLNLPAPMEEEEEEEVGSQVEVSAVSVAD